MRIGRDKMENHMHDLLDNIRHQVTLDKSGNSMSRPMVTPRGKRRWM